MPGDPLSTWTMSRFVTFYVFFLLDPGLQGEGMREAEGTCSEGSLLFRHFWNYFANQIDVFIYSSVHCFLVGCSEELEFGKEAMWIRWKLKGMSRCKGTIRKDEQTEKEAYHLRTGLFMVWRMEGTPAHLAEGTGLVHGWETKEEGQILYTERAMLRSDCSFLPFDPIPPPHHQPYPGAFYWSNGLLNFHPPERQHSMATEINKLDI